MTRSCDPHPALSLLSWLILQNWDRILALQADNMCKAMLNMRLRRRMEEERIVMTNSSGAAAAAAAASSSSSAGAAAGGSGDGTDGGAGSGSVLDKLELGISKLEAAVLRCDESLLLMSEY